MPAGDPGLASLPLPVQWGAETGAVHGGVGVDGGEREKDPGPLRPDCFLQESLAPRQGAFFRLKSNGNSNQSEGTPSQSQLHVDHIQPLIEFVAHLPKAARLNETELAMQFDAGDLFSGNPRNNGVVTQTP